MRLDDRQSAWVLTVFGTVPVVWLGLLTAPFLSGGLMEIIQELPNAMEKPFHIEICKDSVKTVLIFLIAYALGIGSYVSTRRNYRKGEEHGSAKWGNTKVIY